MEQLTLAHGRRAHPLWGVVPHTHLRKRSPHFNDGPKEFCPLELVHVGKWNKKAHLTAVQFLGQTGTRITRHINFKQAKSSTGPNSEALKSLLFMINQSVSFTFFLFASYLRKVNNTLFIFIF